MEQEKKQTVKTVEKKCKANCTNSYQDGKYGAGVRLHIRSAEKDGHGRRKDVYHRCTVCGTSTPESH